MNVAINVVAIDPARLTRMRRRGWDEHGNPWLLRHADGGEPLRCCLTAAAPDDNIALISYTPWTAPSPWAESGPVYVHHEECPGWSGNAWPDDFRTSHSALQPFDGSGARVYEHITLVEPADDHEQAVRGVLAQDDVAVVHVRSATAQCFTFEVRRAGPS